MPTTRTPADRLDQALDALLAGERVTLDASLRPALSVAERLRSTLAPVPPGSRFQAALAERIHGSGLAGRTRRAVNTTRGRLIAAGAVSSAAVGVGVTAYAVWRTSRRHVRPAHR